MDEINSHTGEIIEESKAELFAALSQAQAEFTPVETDKKVDFKTKDGKRVKYDYASFAAIFKMAQKPLAKYGLSVFQTMLDSHLVTTLAHKSGQSVTSVSILPTSNDIKQLGAALSYLRRYQYTAIIGAVVTDEDNENVVEGSVQSETTLSISGDEKRSKLSRPMLPEQVLKVAQIKAAKSTKPANDNQKKYAVSSLSKACGNNDNTRHAIGEYLFGKASSENWTSGECSFVIDWIGATAENNYEPTKEAKQEILTMIDVAMEAAEMNQATQDEEVPF